MRTPARILHTSDLHLHWQHPGPGLQSLAALRAATRSHRADAILVAGDVFDTANQPPTFIDAVAAELNQFECPVILIPGNHDIRYSDAEPDALGDVGSTLEGHHRLISDPNGESVQLMDGALHIWGRGMPEHTPENDPLKGITAGEAGSSWSVVIAHGELTSASASRRSSPIVLERHAARLEQIDYVALGHHDDAHVTRFGSTLVCYSGSASPLLGSMEFALVDFTEPVGASVQVLRLAID